MICPKCKTDKDLLLFGRDKRRKSGYKVYCKQCCNKETTRCQQNKRKSDPDWYIKKLEHGKKYKKNRKIVDTDWDLRVKKQIRECNKKRLQNDSLYRLVCLMRTRTYEAFKSKRWNKDSKFAQYVGCSIDELKTHIESLWQLGMSWDNHGLYDDNNLTWQIDHIKPLSLADSEDELIKLLHYTNLQPLWTIDNLKKGGKYE
jgi:hypothetical protein